MKCCLKPDSTYTAQNLFSSNRFFMTVMSSGMLPVIKGSKTPFLTWFHSAV